MSHASEELKREIVAAESPPKAGRCPVAHASDETKIKLREQGDGLYLNEVGLMSSLERNRRSSREEG